jgi:hypothetical protein
MCASANEHIYTRKYVYGWFEGMPSNVPVQISAYTRQVYTAIIPMLICRLDIHAYMLLCMYSKLSNYTGCAMYMHTYKHTLIHAYIYTYIHSCILHAQIATVATVLCNLKMHAYIHTYIRQQMHTCIHIPANIAR